MDRFAGEWTPPGGFKVPSMLKVTRLSSDTAVPQAAYRAEQASRLREPEVGVEGLSLERALEGTYTHTHTRMHACMHARA